MDEGPAPVVEPPPPPAPTTSQTPPASPHGCPAVSGGQSFGSSSTQAPQLPVVVDPSTSVLEHVAWRHVPPLHACPIWAVGHSCARTEPTTAKASNPASHPIALAVMEPSSRPTLRAEARRAPLVPIGEPEGFIARIARPTRADRAAP